ncbi:MAG: glycerol-3-phosphate 1-O-acyltransferase PlsY [Bacteroidales bacterium]|nr:glycerol-3-phosphate 1-O-acyltransferase PlsY [Bacteroidales bacterium]
MIIATLLLSLFSYLLGSVPVGYLVVRRKVGVDLRSVGSGSTGATNAARAIKAERGERQAVCGFYLILALDMLKGALPVLAARLLWPGVWWLSAVAAAAVAIGHSHSLFLRFKGGKSVAVGFGITLVLCPLAGLCTFALWFLVAHFSHYVSLGSMVAFAAAPLLVWLFGAPVGYVATEVLLGLYIIVLHHQNIGRLLAGCENKTDWI